jgi:uncharacterized membrane protein YfcA
MLLSIAAISFFATLVRSTFGFGESLVAVPLFVLFIPLSVAVPLSVLISIFVALVVVIQDHQQIHLDSARWLILYALLGIPIGLLILVYGNEYWVKIGLGALIIGYSVYSLLGKASLTLTQDSRLWLFICGFLSGVFGGAYGLNGPPLVVYGNMRKWSPKHFRATLQAYFLSASFFGIAGYALKGLLGWLTIRYFLICLPVILPAIFLGRYFNHKLHGASFFTYLYWGLILIGLLLILFTVVKLPRTRLGLTRNDQPAQIAVHQHAPGIGAVFIAFEVGHKTLMGEPNLRLFAFPGDLEQDIRALPLLLIRSEAKGSVGHAPDDLLTGDRLGDLLRGSMYIRHLVGEFGAGFFRVTRDFA